MTILTRIKQINFKKISWRAILGNIKGFLGVIWRMMAFFVLLFIFLFKKFNLWFGKLPKIRNVWHFFQEKTGGFFKPFSKRLTVVVDKIDYSFGRRKTRRTFLINLAFSNLMLKKSRTLMTVLGMSIGVGAIVFLLSLGYGIERLVIKQVATLEEMKIIDVSAGDNTSLRLNRHVYEKIKEFREVQEVIPIVSVVGKLTYNKATMDVVVYAVPKKYFDFSHSKLIKGEFFASGAGVEQSRILPPDLRGKVAGVEFQAEEGEYLKKIAPEKVSFNILPGERAKVFAECNVSAKMLGYTVRSEGGYQGEWIYGSSFYPNKQERVIIDKKRNIYLGRWLRGYFPLYQVGLDGDLKQDMGDGERQSWVEGCIPEREVEVNVPLRLGGVLGEATEAGTFTSDSASGSSTLFETVTVASSAGGLEVVTLQATSSAKLQQNIVEFKAPVSGQVVVSSGLLNLLGIPWEKIEGTEFTLSFVLVKNLMPEIEGRATTTEVAYKVIGVIDDENSSYLYIPFADLYNQSITGFSQMKVVLAKKEDLEKVRKEVETMGFKTSSVVDTVSQIENLFANIRIVLSLLGFVALAVASLGMFNTLTVSLLERTREIGGMKVMGVVAEEVEDLFLAEAMIMGLAGGVGGLIIGSLAGKLVSLIFSLIAFAKQGIFMDLTYTPPFFIIFIICLSFIVGVITGVYPAVRAKRISALNALRYE